MPYTPAMPMFSMDLSRFLYAIRYLVREGFCNFFLAPPDFLFHTLFWSPPDGTAVGSSDVLGKMVEKNSVYPENIQYLSSQWVDCRGGEDLLYQSRTDWMSSSSWLILRRKSPWRICTSAAIAIHVVPSPKHQVPNTSTRYQIPITGESIVQILTW